MEDEEDLQQFVDSLQDWVPTIPDEVTTHFLSKTGFQSPDVRVKRLVALAAQRFVSQVASDVLQHRLRQQSKQRKDKKTVLTMDDLALALKEAGVSVSKPEYFADKPAAP